MNTYKRFIFIFIGALMLLTGCTSKQSNSIKSVFITLDMQHYHIIEHDNTITASLVTDYKTVTVTMMLLEAYVFEKEVKLYVNGLLIEPNAYTVEENNLIYEYDDPNWSGIY